VDLLSSKCLLYQLVCFETDYWIVTKLAAIISGWSHEDVLEVAPLGCAKVGLGSKIAASKLQTSMLLLSEHGMTRA